MNGSEPKSISRKGGNAASQTSHEPDEITAEAKRLGKAERGLTHEEGHCERKGWIPERRE